MVIWSICWYTADVVAVAAAFTAVFIILSYYFIIVDATQLFLLFVPSDITVIF